MNSNLLKFPWHSFCQTGAAWSWDNLSTETLYMYLVNKPSSFLPHFLTAETKLYPADRFLSTPMTLGESFFIESGLLTNYAKTVIILIP